MFPFTLESIPIGIINYMVTLISSHYYHWWHGDIKMWRRNRTVSATPKKKERKERKKRESKREYEWDRKAGRKTEESLENQIFSLLLNDNGFWETTLTNFKFITVSVMFSYLVTAGYVKAVFVFYPIVVHQHSENIWVPGYTVLIL